MRNLLGTLGLDFLQPAAFQLAQSSLDPFANPFLDAIQAGRQGQAQAAALEAQREEERRQREIANFRLMQEFEKAGYARQDRQFELEDREQDQADRDRDMEARRAVVEQLDGALGQEAKLRIGTEGFWDWLDDRQEQAADAEADSQKRQKPIFDQRSGYFYDPITGRTFRPPGFEQSRSSQAQGSPALTPDQRLRRLGEIEERRLGELVRRAGYTSVDRLARENPGQLERLQRAARDLAQEEVEAAERRPDLSRVTPPAPDQSTPEPQATSVDEDGELDRELDAILADVPPDLAAQFKARAKGRLGEASGSQYQEAKGRELEELRQAIARRRRSGG